MATHQACWVLRSQSILDICRFHICKFAYLLTFITPSSILATLSQPLTDMQNGENSSGYCVRSQLSCNQLQVAGRCSCFHSYAVNKGPFHSHFSALFFTWCAFCRFCWLKMAPSMVLSSVPEHKKTAVPYGENTNKLHSYKSYSAVGCDISVNESMK